MTAKLKVVAVKAATLPGVRASLRKLLVHRALVFVYHRFRDTNLGTPGLDPGSLRQALEYLRKEGRELVSLEGIVSRLTRGGPPLNGAGRSGPGNSGVPRGWIVPRRPLRVRR